MICAAAENYWQAVVLCQQQLETAYVPAAVFQALLSVCIA